jgi:C-terminal processing protease CtpA/Prc
MKLIIFLIICLFIQPGFVKEKIEFEGKVKYKGEIKEFKKEYNDIEELLNDIAKQTTGKNAKVIILPEGVNFEFKFETEPGEFEFKGKEFKFTFPDDFLKIEKIFPEFDRPFRGKLQIQKNKPWIGVRVKEVEENSGVEVVEVVPGSPAEKAGIQKGDIITKITDSDGISVEINSEEDLKEEILSRKINEEITLSIKRNGKFIDLKVKVGKYGEKQL